MQLSFVKIIIQIIHIIFFSIIETTYEQKISEFIPDHWCHTGLYQTCPATIQWKKALIM